MNGLGTCLRLWQNLPEENSEGGAHPRQNSTEKGRVNILKAMAKFIERSKQYFFTPKNQKSVVRVPHMHNLQAVRGAAMSSRCTGCWSMTRATVMKQPWNSPWRLRPSRICCRATMAPLFCLPSSKRGAELALRESRCLG